MDPLHRAALVHCMSAIRAREQLEMIMCLGSVYAEKEQRLRLLTDLADIAFGDDEVAHAAAIEAITRRG